MKNIKKMMGKGILFSILIGGLVSSVQAEIFKCTNSKGKVFYNDKPCPIHDDEKKLRAVKDPKNGYIPETSFQFEKEEIAKGVVVAKENNKDTKLAEKVDKENKIKTPKDNRQSKEKNKQNADALTKSKADSTISSNLNSTKSSLTSNPLAKEELLKNKRTKVTEKFYPKGSGKDIVPPGLIE